MTNMHHCRFTNTVIDLEQLIESDDLWYDIDLSESEARAKKKLIKLCVEIAETLGDDGDIAENL